LISSILTIFGFFASIIGIVLGFKLGLEDEDRKREKRIATITDNVFIYKYPDSNKLLEYQLRVFNNSKWTIHSCGAYLTVDNTSDDVIDNKNELKYYPDSTLDNISFYIDKQKARPINIEKLCWSQLDSNDKNNHKADINAGEIQDLLVFKFTENNNLEIAAETGFSSFNGRARCILKSKNYSFTIRIVSDDTIGKDFLFEYDSFKRTLMPKLENKP